MSLDTKLFTRLCQKSPSLCASAIEKNFNKLQKEYLLDLSPTNICELVALLSPNIAQKIFLLLDKQRLDKVIFELLPAQVIRIFLPLLEKDRQQFFNKLSDERKNEIKEILDLPHDCAGALMDKHPLVLRRDDKIKTAIEKIHANKQKSMEIFVVGSSQKLLGQISAATLLGEDENTLIGDLMIPQKKSLSLFEKSEEIKTIFDETKTSAIPVLGLNGELLGVVHHNQIVQAVEQDAAQDLMAMSGVSREERALSTPIYSVKSRLPWLIINLGTAFLAAAIVGLFENTIAKVTALAVLMPVVAGQSGNTGAQAMAVAMRGLALKEIRTRNFLKLLFKELQVGFLNGAAIATFTSLGVLLWNPDKLLAALLGLSMISAMILASITGALIPLILTALGRDPATSSSIILTTMTDVISFFSFLGLATIFITQLTT